MFQITDKTLISLNVVVILFGAVVFGIKLSDRVERVESYIADLPQKREAREKQLSEMDRRIYKLELAAEHNRRNK